MAGPDCRPRPETCRSRPRCTIRAFAILYEVMHGGRFAELRRIHVLVIDDNVNERNFLRSVLELAGAIVTAASAADAIRVALADVIVCDLTSAEAARPEFLPELRHVHIRLGRMVPAIALVSTGEMSNARARAPGFERYLPKPIDADELRAAVSDLARRY